MRFLAVIFLALILRLYNLNQSFWLDEAAQVIESSRPLTDQFSLAADFHPPLYHLVLHFWMYLGHSEVWIRLLSVFLGVGSTVLIYKLGSILDKKNTAFLTAFFMTISPYHVWYSQEARPYMLFTFLSLLATLFLLKRKWLFYFVSLSLVFYSSYFSIFLLLGHIYYILYFDRGVLPKFISSLVGVSILFSFWLPSFINQLKIGTSGFFSGWTDIVSTPFWKSLPLTLAKFIFGKGSIENNFIYGLVLLPVFILFLVSLKNTLKSLDGKKISVLFITPLVTALIVSIFIPIVAPQRLIFLLPIFYLLLAKGIYTLPKNWRNFALLTVILTSILGLLQYYTNPYVQREEWRQAVSFVERERPGQKSMALFVFPDPFAPYIWYKKDLIESMGIAPKFKLRDKDLILLGLRLQSKKSVFLFQYLTDLTDPEKKTSVYIESLGYSLTAIKNFPGVGLVYLYDKK